MLILNSYNTFRIAYENTCNHYDYAERRRQDELLAILDDSNDDEDWDDDEG